MIGILRVRQIDVSYHKVIQVLKGVSLEVREGQIVCLLGANGAGKSTTLKAISGLLISQAGMITDGEISFLNERIDKKLPHVVAKMGIVQVLEGRRIFQHLTVDENLRVGYIGNESEKFIQESLEKVYELFSPRLAPMKHRICGFLSGGEQQMVVIGRALMSSPKIMLLDEPSLGLAPLLVQDIFKTIDSINRNNNTAILLVEQNAMAAMEYATYCYVMENGRIVLDGTATKLKDNEDIKEFYLGLSSVGDKKSYRDTKHYKRRKRWIA